MMSVTPAVRIFANVEALSHAAARALAEAAQRAVAERGRFVLVLSGGNTPRTLYRLLAGSFREQLPWPQTELFWGDERYVPRDHPQSNYRMVKEMMLDHVPVRSSNVHPMPTDMTDPEDAARAYESDLRARFPDGLRFDLVLLGLASDGHTASLFPAADALEEDHRLVVAVRVPANPPRRLTMTLPALNQADQVYFLVAGRAKAGALHRAMAGPLDLKGAPASGVRPKGGTVTWWIDDAAAVLLPGQFRAPVPPA